ncbi:ATP-binding protein [Streptomyces sp. NPDC058385]|uniref:ATP-binding protein n=1 Tax=Streptomyces sp. NPDC058385 TaxID=3346473 RepID=UPI003659ED4C
MHASSGIAILSRHPRAAAEARTALHEIAPSGSSGADTAALLLTEVVSNAVRHGKGAAIGVAVGFDPSADVITGAVFDREPGMSAGDRAGLTDEGQDMECGRGLDLLDAASQAWGVATAGDRGKWVWFQVPAA